MPRARGPRGPDRRPSCPARRLPARQALACAFAPLPLLAALGGATAARAQGPEAAAPPVVLEAAQVRGQPDGETVAEGQVDLRRGGLRIEADRLRYGQADGIARATGQVRIERDGDVYTGTELQLQIERFEGWFLNPDYQFARTGAGGRAARIDFTDRDRSTLTDASYTSCLRDGTGTPDWLLEADRVRLDFEANEGIAEGAVLRFLGVPILGLPVMSFPVTDDRKSGWLPPDISLDNKSGLELAVPYYWNIAPNRDMTLTPMLATRRGLGLEAQLRYLEPQHEGELALHLLPDDRVAQRNRHAFAIEHESSFAGDLRLQLDLQRVSDDDYWKDFARYVPELTPRLLSQRLEADRPLADLIARDWTAYARVQQWQVLQADEAPIDPPYARLPQAGLAGRGQLAAGVDYRLQTEVNRFERRRGNLVVLPPPGNPGLYAGDGTRWHVLASVERRWQGAGWFVTPRLQLNSAAYQTDDPMADGRTRAARTIPTASLDAGLVLERPWQLFGWQLRQTLEPRLLYVNTPRRRQADLPNFDAAEKDFNEISLYSENTFSGIDRVSDAHQLTAGVQTRLLDAATGNEAMRFLVAQRYLFRDQAVTPNDDAPLTRRLSDLLLVGSSSLGGQWSLDGSLSYSPEIDRVTRSLLGARWSPGPFRTISTRYRYARGLSEQVELGWQWPLHGADSRGRRQPATAGGSCSGALYGVGRLNYSLRDSRMTDTVLGLEYDAGCWIGRIVAERQSTGTSEATTRLMLQLELVGLSRLGTNPLGVLKDNIPGYRLLREDIATPPPPTVYD